MTRPRLEIVRPQRMSILDEIVECNYMRGHCFYRSGPYSSRDDAAEAAHSHWAGVHARPESLAAYRCTRVFILEQMKTCTAPDCDGRAPHHALCDKHRYRMRKYGSLDLPVKDTKPPLAADAATGDCAADGCDTPTRGGKTYCEKHYSRLKRLGTLELPERAPSAPKLCSLGDGKVVNAKGVCAMHYQRMKMFGSYDPPPKPIKAPPAPCIAPGCKKDGIYAGMCPAHYQRKRAHGSFELPERAPKAPPAPCRYEGCDRLATVRAFCQSHYQLAMKANDDSLIGVWRQGPIVRDSTGFSFVWHCEEHNARSVQFTLVDSINGTHAHWGVWHRGILPDAVFVEQEDLDREGRLPDGDYDPTEDDLELYGPGDSEV